MERDDNSVALWLTQLRCYSGISKETGRIKCMLRTAHEVTANISGGGGFRGGPRVISPVTIMTTLFSCLLVSSPMMSVLLG